MLRSSDGEAALQVQETQLRHKRACMDRVREIHDVASFLHQDGSHLHLSFLPGDQARKTLASRISWNLWRGNEPHIYKIPGNECYENDRQTDRVLRRRSKERLPPQAPTPDPGGQACRAATGWRSQRLATNRAPDLTASPAFPSREPAFTPTLRN